MDFGIFRSRSSMRCCRDKRGRTPKHVTATTSRNAASAKLNAVARRLNERPRKTLNYETPAERFQQTIASTG
jgi:IS30 family transposase